MSDQTSGNTISAEVDPVAGQAYEAALGMQRLGFRILHIGPTISVEGPQSLWESIFQISFQSRTKNTTDYVEGDVVTYPEALTEGISLPKEIQGLVEDVMFVKPPELF